MKSTTIILISAFFTIGNFCFAEETDPSAIFKKVMEKYKSMQTYSSEGTIVSDMDIGSMEVSLETSFSMKLKKPNLYLISWKGNMQSGAVWNDGTQSYLYMGMVAYSKMKSDEMALAGATGISGGAG